jgi:hypothetical protein
MKSPSLWNCLWNGPMERSYEGFQTFPILLVSITRHSNYKFLEQTCAPIEWATWLLLWWSISFLPLSVKTLGYRAFTPFGLEGRNKMNDCLLLDKGPMLQLPSLIFKHNNDFLIIYMCVCVCVCVCVSNEWIPNMWKRK